VLKGLIGIAVAVGLAILAVGCGGGGDEALSKAEFLKQGNAICKKAEEERGKVIAAVAQNANPKANVAATQEKVIRKAIPTYEEAARQIAELGVPAGDEAKVESLVSAMEEAAERAIADPATAVATAIPFKKANELAKDYGLQGCVV
jgi:hypothetical protein